MNTWIKTICLIAAFALIPMLGMTAPTTWDVDGDGIENNQDNCPENSNVDQENFDGDFWGDVCDGDDDNDGISDLGEQAAGTDPFDPDTDDDGVGDAYDCNPLDKQKAFYGDCFLIVIGGSDGGGSTGGGDGGSGNDGGSTGGGTGGTDPDVNPPVDTDGDGCSDDAEIGMHTSPTNVDSDGDGVTDCIDNCPIVSNGPNTEISDNQTDINSDGIGDACQIDIDNDGIPDVNDYDGDGIADDDDNCLFIPNPAQLDSDADGVGEVCDPDSEFFGGPEPALHAQGGGGAGSCTLSADSSGRAASAVPLAIMMLATLLVFGIRRKIFQKN